MPGWPFGPEAIVPGPSGPASGWVPWFVGDERRPSIARGFVETFFADMATPGTPIDWRSFDLDRDLDKLAWIRSVLDAKTRTCRASGREDRLRCSAGRTPRTTADGRELLRRCAR
jgi:hypothetical protein